MSRPTIPKIQRAQPASPSARSRGRRPPGADLGPADDGWCQVLVGRDNCPGAEGESPAFVVFRGTTSPRLERPTAACGWSPAPRAAQLHGGFAQSWQSVEGRVRRSWRGFRAHAHHRGLPWAARERHDRQHRHHHAVPRRPRGRSSRSSPRWQRRLRRGRGEERRPLRTRVVHNDVVPRRRPSRSATRTATRSGCTSGGDVEWKPQDGWWSEMCPAGRAWMSRELGVTFNFTASSASTCEKERCCTSGARKRRHHNFLCHGRRWSVAAT
jgi:hypothetical protein